MSRGFFMEQTLLRKCSERKLPQFFISRIQKLKWRSLSLVSNSERPLIEVQAVSRIYSLGAVPVAALQGVSFTVAKGEFVAIVGKSGSGKSTLLNLIGGMDRPTSGEIIVAGRTISQMSRDELAHYRRNMVGMIFQAFNLIPSMSAWENVAMPMLFAGKAQSERQARAKELLARVGLAHRYNHRPVELSGGEQQRVAIARALVNDPYFLLADEPTGNLDSRTSDEIVHLLHHIHQQGKTVLMITHDHILAEQLSTRIITLKDGEIICDEAHKPALTNLQS
jgi:putative ABC transport system ATP-binding protein